MASGPTFTFQSPTPEPCEETCRKCGGEEISVRWLGAIPINEFTSPMDSVLAGMDRLELKCKCGFSWQRPPLTPDVKQASPAKDPMHEATVTLAALHKILDERARQMEMATKEIVAAARAELIEDIRRGKVRL